MATSRIGPGTPQPASPRRSFLWSFGATVVGLVLTAAAAAPAVWVFVDPFVRRSRPPRAARRPATVGEGYYRVARLDAIAPGGLPQRFPVLADRMDAWNYTPSQPIGAVFIRRLEDGRLQVFQSICPHAGCSVAAVQTAEGPAFHCPCHNSSFAVDGHRVARPGKRNPSPRDLDQLNYQIVNDEVWVEYKEFYSGRPEKVVKA